jgi:multicomponent Na+:H+ antiporter subunit D
MTKIWTGAFWGDTDPAPRSEAHIPAAMLVPTGALVALSLAVALFAGPLYGLAERAAVDLLDGAAYQQAVRG